MWAYNQFSESDKREAWVTELEEPFPGAAPSQATLESEGEAFMALMQQQVGG